MTAGHQGGPTAAEHKQPLPSWAARSGEPGHCRCQHTSARRRRRANADGRSALAGRDDGASRSCAGPCRALARGSKPPGIGGGLAAWAHLVGDEGGGGVGDGDLAGGAQLLQGGLLHLQASDRCRKCERIGFNKDAGSACRGARGPSAGAFRAPCIGGGAPAQRHPSLLLCPPSPVSFPVLAFMPRSLATNSAPVTMAMSCSSALRRSPKPGACGRAGGRAGGAATCSVHTAAQLRVKQKPARHHGWHAPSTG